VDRVAQDYAFNSNERLAKALAAREARKRPLSVKKSTLFGETDYSATAKVRTIVHPNYKPGTTSQQIERELETLPDGEALLRPSTNRAGLSLAWSVRRGVYKHVTVEDVDDLLDVQENASGKPLYDTRGVLIPRNAKKGQFRVGGQIFEEIDDIIANYVNPMNDLVEATVSHRKFDGEVLQSEAAQTKLTILRRADAHTIHYFVWLDPTNPGYFVLSWLPQHAASARHEYVEVKPDGLTIRNRLFKSIDKAIAYFKAHAQEWMSSKSSSSGAPTRPRTSAVSSRHLSSATTPRLSTPSHRTPSHSRTPSHHTRTPSTTTRQTPSHRPAAVKQELPPLPPPVAPPVVPPAPGGRGRGATLPAWMTQS